MKRSKPSREKSIPKKGSPFSKKREHKKFERPAEEVRLNKFIAHAGVCNRREADELIKSGLIIVNGKKVTEMGTKVKKGDVVKYQDTVLKGEKKVYVLLNKPKDFVTTTKDPHHTKTVMNLVDKACEERIYPVGRLDRNTTGLLLFTNDGNLAKKLTHPSHRSKKIYHTKLDRIVEQAHLKAMEKGIQLEDGLAKADRAEYVNSSTPTAEVGLEIHMGRKHIVKRMFAHFNYKVVALDRVYFAGLTKKNLPRGKWRFLSAHEVRMLQMQTGK